MLRIPVNRKKYPDFPFKAITVRSTSGEDEEEAQVLVAAKGERGIHLNELVKLSIVAVDDRRVLQPFNAYDRWPTRARNMVVASWRKLNGMTEKTFDDDFFEHAEHVSEDSIAPLQLDDAPEDVSGEDGSE